MTLQEFLKEINEKESDIIEYKGNEALIKVRQDGCALIYVKDQNEEICLEAVKQDGYALRYVNKKIFDTKTELTLKEIADKFNIDVNDLRIKED